MSVYQIVFSPTGGTKKVSGLFTDSFDATAIPIDLADRNLDFSTFSFRQEDICIIAVPSYGGRVPDIAAIRLGRMKGGNARAILIAVYGNRAYDDTFTELQDILQNAGFSCIAAIAAIAEHSIMHQFAAGRPDAQDEKELAEFAETIRSKIEAEQLSPHLNLPGNRPYREYHGVPIKPQAGKACIKCVLCAQKCPVGAISKEDPSKTDAKSCISCMRCIAVCPRQARNVSKALLAASSLKLKKACDGHKKNELFL